LLVVIYAPAEIARPPIERMLAVTAERMAQILGGREREPYSR
jgi:hypothetical protein